MNFLAKLFSALILLFAALLCSCTSTGASEDKFDAEKFFNVSEDKFEKNTVPYLYYKDMGMWNHLYAATASFVTPEAVPSSIIIPHHDITIQYQNRFYKALSRYMSPKVIVIICPDHYERGGNLIAVADSIEFDSPERKISLDEQTVQKLLASDLKDYVSVNNELWFKEHGIFVHTAFIGHYFPEAKIVPVVLRPEDVWNNEDVYKRLGKFFAETLDENSLVIGSVDLSHYQKPRMTDVHDVKTLNTVANMEDFRSVEVDSPESLTCVAEYSRAKGFTNPVLMHTTSTFDFIPDENVVSTSHEYWAFYNDEQKSLIEDYVKNVRHTKQRVSFIDYDNTVNQTILIGGSGTFGFGIRDLVLWDRYNTSTDEGLVNTKKIAGDEARFLKGFDAYIFDARLKSDFSPKKIQRLYSHSLHKTSLFVDGIGMDGAIDFHGDAADYGYEFSDDEENKNSLKILVIINDDEKNKAAAGKISEAKKNLDVFYSRYDIVIIRDNTGTADSFAYLNRGNVEVNLGIMKNSRKNAGKLLAVIYRNGEMSYEVFTN